MIHFNGGMPSLEVAVFNENSKPVDVGLHVIIRSPSDSLTIWRGINVEVHPCIRARDATEDIVKDTNVDV